MKTITLAMPFDEVAAQVAEVLARRGILAPMPVDLVALGLARWCELELANLLAQAPALAAPANATGRRLIAALAAAARLEASDPPLTNLRRRREAARQLAKRHARKVAGWMLHSQWHAQIGCNVCQLQGPAAPCWGTIGCHGYASGCGCADCTVRSRVAEFRNATAQTQEGTTL